MERAIATRAPIGALQDIETFMSVAGQLKSLVVQLAERRARESRYQRSLERQIKLFRTQCEELAKDNPRVRVLWQQAEAELQPLESQP